MLAGFLLIFVAASAAAQTESGTDGLKQFRSEIAELGAKLLLYSNDEARKFEPEGKTDRQVLAVLDDILEEALRFVNSALIMTELQEYTDGRPRVKELILTWIRSGREMIRSRSRTLDLFERLDDLSLDAVHRIELIKERLGEMDTGFAGLEELYEP